VITRVHTYYLNKLPVAFQAKILVTSNGCWEWQGEINRNGYGRYSINGWRFMTHRFTYEFLIAPIKNGLILDHICRNRPCCNPTHTSPVTHRQNTHRGHAKLFNNKTCI